jgi:hypothetical protein
VIDVPAVDTGTFDSERHYIITVVPGDTLLEVTIGGGTGTADLYLRYGEVPNPEHGLFDCFPNLSGSSEQCRIPNPTPGPWYATIVGFPFSYQGVILTARVYR